MGDISTGNGAQRQKSGSPAVQKNGGSLPRNPKTDISRDASRFRRSGAPSPAGTNVFAGAARRSDTDRSQARFEGHSSVPKLGNDRTAFPEWTAGSGRETCLRVDSGHTPHAPPSGAPVANQDAMTPNQADTRPPNCGLTESFQDAGAMLLSETLYLSRICTFAGKSGQHQIKKTGVRNASERLSVSQPAEHQRPQEAVRPAPFSIPHKPRIFFCLSLTKVSFRRRYASTPRPTALRTKLPYYKSRARRKTGGPPAEAGGPPDGFALTRRRRSGRAPSP